ncbi:MAG: transketolase [Candidatus Scalindua sp.]|jgi:transketolase|nr:transketolase [Candidatus Scalindua sp.]MBT6230262.1 transketolase [Candidatus Scalindua sp.]
MNTIDKNLSFKAKEIRKSILEVACKSKTAHVGSVLSCVDILTSLYFHELKIDKNDWSNRDIFVLSKGHAALALYTILAHCNIITKKKLFGYLQNNGTLPAHLDKFLAKGIEVSAGSLGHGFNIALGIAHGLKLKKSKRRVFALIGDGESQEGSIWEGAMFASKLGIDNFTVILDHNNLQGYGRPKDICKYEPVIDKWKAFGWETYRINGHNFNEIRKALKGSNRKKPKIIVADTIKGKGVPFMENMMKWHYYIVTEDIKRDALHSLY